MKKFSIRIPITFAILFYGFIQAGYSQMVDISDTTFLGIKLRSIGPAMMSGRIADIAIHPMDDNMWYVAVGSGGVWKTKNAGVTWKPIFDDQASYSIGCVTIDHTNPNIIWIGTGENVGGRHVGYGDGIYKSKDGGNSWENMGLKESQHISKIIIHPDNSDVIWVAAQGPLWNKGGERGVFKSKDGGKTWKRTLGDEEWIGVTDLLIDPRDSQVLYAATWQRNRNVATYMGGGPGSGIHKSMDGGDSWEELTVGLPTSNMGKIGLAISPQNPDIIYAAIELDRRKGGIYRSADRGATWEKRSDVVSGATGPHYYQELYASPHHFERIYLVDVRMQISEDGGKNFRRMKEEHKHSDNHALVFRQDDPDYLLVGTDGGLYESFDLAENWRFIANLPVTQFYKVALDDAEPFYTIYGGTQDNNTQGGPSRTDNYHGIRNADWFITLFGDGHQPATEPGNPNIMYSEWQEGNLTRIDRATGELVYIKPQPDADETNERYNWDAPILVSPHSPTRLYFASQRVWMSENRGDSWKAISGDLTRNQERVALPIMGKTQSWDEPWDMLAMSNYNTITSLAQSPIDEGLLYAGTDDGIIQVTEDGGDNWRKIEVNRLPGVPETAFVNDIKADLYDENTVYVVLDNHKFGDLDPYVFKSTDRGKSWKSIKSNLPDRTLAWRIVQDHVKPELLFLATEFGIYFTFSAGDEWYKIKGDVPTISFRDLAIQKRENDLVAASFGRGFFVLDDYSFLRNCDKQILQKEAALFPARKAWWYIQRPVLDFGSARGSSGADHYVAPNPPFGAVFTYYLAEDIKTKKELRQEKEKQLAKEKSDIPFPGWKELEVEHREEDPKIWLIIKDANGDVVRKIISPAKKGFHRVAWDLKYPSKNVVRIQEQKGDEPDFIPSGAMVAPGTYTVTMSKKIGGEFTTISEAIEFKVERLRKGSLEGAPPEETVAFWKELDRFTGQVSSTSIELQSSIKKVDAMKKALSMADSNPGDLYNNLYTLKDKLMDLDEELNGSKSKQEIGEKTKTTVMQRISVARTGTAFSTYGPTPLQRQSLDIAISQHKEIRGKLDTIVGVDIPTMIKALKKAGAPNIEGFLRE